MPEQNHEGRTVLVTKISQQLAQLTASVTIDVKNNLSTRNVLAENILAGLLNRMQGWQLINANRIRSNYPAVDLVDMENRIAIQVTSTNGAEKINHTLEEFEKNELDQDYDRLYVVIITTDNPTPSMRSKSIPGVFSGETDIWNIPTLEGKLMDLPVPVLEGIHSYLTEELGKLDGSRPYLCLPPDSALGDGFVGRETELSIIRNQIDQGVKPVVLSGLGGMGKTELAARFGRLYADGDVYFIRFQTSFTTTITGLYGKIIPAPMQPPSEKEQLEAVIKLLSRCTEKDLLIFDNVDADNGDLSDLMQDEVYKKLRQMRPRMILTTRFDWDRAIPVRPLPDEKLKEIFLTHGTVLEDQQMNDLIEAVNGHTMTIDLMARTLNGKGWRKVTAEDLLRAIRENTLPSEKYRKIATDYNQSQEQAQIYQHLSVVFDVSGIPEPHRNVLRCATLLPQDGMDGELFGYSLCENQQEALDELLDHGWLSMENDLLRIHPIIRLVCREELKPSDESCGEFLYAVAKHLNPHKNDPACIRQSAELYSHASDILKDIDGDWALFAGLNYFYSGDLAKALNYYNRTIERAETEVLSLETVLAAYNNAGSAYDKLGKYKEAIDHHLVALAVIEKMYPNDSSKKMAYWNNIGASLSNLGDDENALKYKMDALEALKKEKPGSVEMAICLDNIGSTYGDIGKTDTALHFHLQALEILEKEETIELAITLDNIGGIYDKKKEYPTALKFKLRALRIFKRFYSGKNIDLALAYGNVYYTYAAQGDFVSALNYIEKAIQAVPDDHPKLRNYKALREELLNLIKMKRLGIDFPNPFEHP